MNVGLVAGTLWAVIAFGLAVDAAMGGSVTRAVLWGTCAVVAVVYTVKFRGDLGPARV